MQRILGLIALIGLLLLSTGPVLADDGFYVVGMGSGVGTKITSLPYTITESGFYYVARNLVAPAGQDGIIIKADNVTLDLMGFKVSGPAWSNIGILLFGGRADVEIRNGTLTNWASCIRTDISNVDSSNVRVINVRVQAYDKGVWLFGSNHLIKGCQARNTIHAFYGDNGTITGCMVQGDQNSSLGVYLNQGIATGNYISNIKSGVINKGIRVGVGLVSGNTVIDCHFGIEGGNPINYNAILGCLNGIRTDASSVIGNSVVSYTLVDSIGIDMSFSIGPNLLTQNTVVNYKTPFMPGSGSVNVANTNAGF